MSNPGFADVNHISGEVSSCCEVLYGILDPDKVDLTIATAIYTGMVHDTGVFQYSSTSPETMRIAGELMKTGIPISARSLMNLLSENIYVQNQVMGRVLAESILLQNGTCIIGYLRKKRYGFLWCDGKRSGWHCQSASSYSEEWKLPCLSMKTGDSVFQSFPAFQWQGGCKQSCSILWRRRSYESSRM